MVVQAEMNPDVNSVGDVVSRLGIGVVDFDYGTLENCIKVCERFELPELVESSPDHYHARFPLTTPLPEKLRRDVSEYDAVIDLKTEHFIRLSTRRSDTGRMEPMPVVWRNPDVFAKPKIEEMYEYISSMPTTRGNDPNPDKRFAGSGAFASNDENNPCDNRHAHPCGPGGYVNIAGYHWSLEACEKGQFTMRANDVLRRPQER